MAILPGFDEFLKPNLTSAQFRFYVSFNWIMILFFAGLMVLLVANIWTILIKQGRWKTLPLLLFYTLTFIAVVVRELDLTVSLKGSEWRVICWIQPIAKLGVGLI